MQKDTDKKEQVFRLIEHAIYAEMEMAASNNALTEQFNNYNPLIHAFVVFAARRVVSDLNEQGLVLIG